MKKLIILLLIGVIVFQSGCITSTFLETRPVLYLNISLMGTYDRPIIDITNTSTSIEVLPLLKNPRYDKSSTLPIIYVEVFHAQDKISYFTSEPYNGPKNYILKVAFKDGKKIPASTNESMTVLVGAVDHNGTMILKEYINVRWPANS